MKPYLSILISVILIFSSCKKEKIKSCDGFSGSVIESAMISAGGSAMADAINQVLNSNGMTTKFACSNGMGSSNLSFGVTYVDQIHQNVGNIQLDQMEIFNEDAVSGGLSFPTNPSPILSLFGQTRFFKQLNKQKSAILNQCTIDLPKPFTTEGNSADAIIENGGVNISWPNATPMDSLFLLIYSTPMLGNNQINGLIIPKITAIKIPDNGSYFVPSTSSQLSQIPINCVYAIHLVRLKFTLYNDLQVNLQKNVVISTASSMKLLKKT